MLSASLDLADLSLPVLQEAGLRCVVGGSHVDGFASSMLTMSTRRVDAARTAVWIGEDDDPFPGAEAIDAEAYRRFSLYAGVLIAIRTDDGDGGRGVDVLRTATGSSPLYVSDASGVLVLSWRFEEVALSIPDRRPDVEACRLFVRHGTRPVRDQIIRGMRMIWPGEAMRYGGNGIAIEQAPSTPIALTGPIREDARVTERFLDLTAEAMRRTLERSRRPLVEYSGGFDSSCVALAAHRIRSDLASYAVIHEGPIGRQQEVRRRELIEAIGLRDHVGPSFMRGPYESLREPECGRTPLDDVYRLPCVEAVEAHPAGPFDVVVTGIGGDELTLEGTHRRETWEVAGPIASSALDAAAGRCDMFMRRGIWPVQPFTSPEVVDFCRSLPARFRSGRMLNVLTLARAGLSDGYIFPRYSEHYGEIGRREAYLTDFDELFAESPSADFGIVDISALLDEARRGTREGLCPKLTLRLWFVAKLDAVLRTYLS